MTDDQSAELWRLDHGQGWMLCFALKRSSWEGRYSVAAKACAEIHMMSTDELQRAWTAVISLIEV